MDTRKNKNKIILIIGISAAIISFLAVVGYIVIFFIFGLNYATSGGNTQLPTKLHGISIRKISDSLYKEKWKHNLPFEWQQNLTDKGINFNDDYWYFIPKTDSTQEICIGIQCYYRVVYLDVVYKDSAIIYYTLMSENKRQEYEEILRETVFKDIEKEAKRQNLPDSFIYLPKEWLEEYGYHEFAKKIYPD